LENGETGGTGKTLYWARGKEEGKSHKIGLFFDHATLAEVRDKFRDDQRGEPQKKRVGVKINV